MDMLAQMQRIYIHMRPGTFSAGNNTSQRANQVLGTHGAVMMPRLMVVQDNQGAPVATADAEMYFRPNLPIRVNDQLLDQGDGTRWRVVKIFAYPAKTVVWAARTTS